ncbi:unnamed protein product [Choristocarpus tenellus]
MDIGWCMCHTTTSWAEGVLSVLSRVSKPAGFDRTRYACAGLGLTSRVVGTDPAFTRLCNTMVRKAYR